MRQAHSGQTSIRVDAAKTHGELKPIYRFFGADEPNYAYMKDGRKLLGDIGQLGEPQEYFRAHSLLVTTTRWVADAVDVSRRNATRISPKRIFTYYVKMPAGIQA